MSILYTRDGTERKANGKTEKGAPLYRSNKTCWRCGGEGGSIKWQHTGWTCYRCGGKGIDPNKLEEKLYTAEKLAKLNAAQAIRDEKKRVAREEAAAIEQERQLRERDEVLARYEDTIRRIRDAVPPKYDEDGESHDPLLHDEGFLPSLYRQITVQYRPLTEAQQDALTRVLDKIEAEKARIKASGWVGNVKDRLELTLTLKKVVTWGDRYSMNGITYLMIMRTPEGHTVLYKGASPYSLGFKATHDPRDGSTFDLEQVVRVKATVTEHKRSKYNNECETYIARPQVLEN